MSKKNDQIASVNSETRSFFIPNERLFKYDEFLLFTHPEKDVIIAYIQWAYNAKSPLVSEYESLQERRIEASIRAYNKQHYPRGETVPYGSILHLLSHSENNPKSLLTDESRDCLDKIMDMILCYTCKLQNDNTFNQYYTLQSLFWQYQRKLLEDVDEKIGDDKVLKAFETKTKITPFYLALSNQIEELRKKLIGEDSDLSKKLDIKVGMKRPESKR